MRRAAVGELVAVDAGDDQVVEPQPPHRLGEVARLERVERPRQPLSTSQNRQPRVQISPISMTVAVPEPQHSPMFGQLASSQTVARFSSASVRRTLS